MIQEEVYQFAMNYENMQILEYIESGMSKC